MRVGTKFKLVLCGVLLLVQPAVTPPPADAMGNRPDDLGAARALPKFTTPEDMVVKALNAIRAQRLDEAQAILDSLLATRPDFRLAQLMRGDLLAARVQPLAQFGGGVAAPAGQVDDLRQEAVARLKRYAEAPPKDRVPENLLQLLPEQRHAVVVDARASRLYLFQNVDGLPRYVADYYISIGKNGSGKNKEGDKLTPVGVYTVTTRLPKERLTDFYGPVAFPISYPNEWDRRLGRDGHGIWLHGTPSDTYSRPPRASDGCVVLTNLDIQDLGRSIQPGLTPVVISDGVKWVTPLELHKERDALADAVDAWRRDWESRDTDRYLAHYSSEFSSDGMDRAAWGQQKRQVNAGKTWIEVKLNRVSLFRYPGKDDLAVVTFDQDYRSNNLNNRMRKRQYWKLENGAWRILYEGAA